MKRIIFLLFTLGWVATTHAYFIAHHLTDTHYSWRTFKLKQLSCQMDVRGLFYETTIEFQIELTKTRSSSPRSGTYEIHWSFELPEDAVITDCAMKPADALLSDFISAEIVDLTTAEELYRTSPQSQPRLLLQQRILTNWDGTLSKHFYLKFSPVTLTKIPVVKIRYLTQCQAVYNSRRITLPLALFSVYKICPVLLRFYDPDNPAAIPEALTGINTSLTWKFSEGYWQAGYTTPNYASLTIFSIVPENAQRSYLRTFTNDKAQFYQLSVLPPIPPENRIPKNILLAVDNTDQGQNVLSCKRLLEKFEQAVNLSVSEFDSIGLIYSGFTTEFYDTTFTPVTTTVLNNIFKTLRNAEVPSLNTLPQLLKRAVKFLNRQQKAGEIWLLTNARAHSDPPATAMEIVSQSLNAAEYPLVFRIINNDRAYDNYYRKNSKMYWGNDYLYENLARLSWGSFVKLRNQYDYNILDLMLDCIAPTATTVETDPEPAGGLSYSRFPLNQGRVNFPITRPYYEIGLFDGLDPFNLHFFGFLDHELYARDVLINREPDDAGWPEVATFWYSRYVLNRLKEPQSYETIKYIENISVEQRLLTPYSGFIIPGPDGVLAFQRLADPETGVAEKTVENPVKPPETISLAAWPNPFNPETTISCQLPGTRNSDQVKVKIFNCLGQVVQDYQIEIGEKNSNVRINWNGRDIQGQHVASGLYIVRATIGNQTNYLKITLSR